ncbi:lactate utilization protein C [Micromonospora sp. NBC_00898]|uniref:LutC/YkgG family protein n=1 Tax=Micromonospora sp. NBC_00898 TaxID=2975981 RepID=UPI0038663B6F|nr:lactate utilization protein C [Micromonospora sp. NBC_00898]
MDARTAILERIRAALGNEVATVHVPREYLRTARCADPVTVFVDRLVDYRATVRHCDQDALADALGTVLADSPTLVVPPDVPDAWLQSYAGMVCRDGDPAPLSLAELNAASAVLTGCTVAVATTGTIVLDAGATQGRRALTLVPDRHVCVVRVDQIVPSVPEAVARLHPGSPLTWISGPSATSDIELNRVEGVHGPRRLEVVLVR